MTMYSKDLRQRILNYGLVHSVRQTAKLFQVSPTTVQSLKQLYYETGGITPHERNISPDRLISTEGELWLQAILVETPDLSLAELCDRYYDIYRIRVSPSTMYNTVTRFGYSFKKKTFYDPERDTVLAAEEKTSYINQLDGVNPEDRVYLDEMGCASNLSPEHGRSPQGERLYDASPTAPGVTVNTAAVLTEKGVEAVLNYTGNLNTDLFIGYLQLCVLHLLTEGKVLIMDNHPVHCAKAVMEFLDSRNVAYVYLPRYSPELNPIEEAFSKIKHTVRKFKPRLPIEIYNAIRAAIKMVTENDAIGYINHSEEFLLVTG
jgi:transposase